MASKNRWSIYENILKEKYKELREMYLRRNSDNWQLDKVEEGIKVYSKFDHETGLKTIRGEGVINAPADKIIETALDASRNKDWDTTMEAGKIVESNNNYHVFYNLLKRIGFLSKREVLTVFHEFKEKDGTIYGVGTSIENPLQPSIGSYIRAHVKIAGWVLEPIEGKPNATYVTYILSADPKGSIPKTLVNWFAEQQGMNVGRLGKYIERNIMGRESPAN